MIGRYVRAGAIAIALAAALPAPAPADNMVCPGSIPAGNGSSVNGKSDRKYEVTASSGLTAMATDGSSFHKAFAYMYVTRGAGAFIQDSQSHAVTPVSGTDPGAIKKGLAKISQIPGIKLSAGAHAIVSGGWSLVVYSCNP
jgi:hypothetical protein